MLFDPDYSCEYSSRDIIADNIKRLMRKKGVVATDVCKALNIPNATFSDWINAKTYPRIAKLEKLAEYFGVSKSELVEFYIDRNDPLLELARVKPSINEEEQELVRCWRAATDSERENVAFILRDYGMPRPKGRDAGRQSASAGE